LPSTTSHPVTTSANYLRNWIIDIVALNEQTGEILFCDCKWQDNVNSEKLYEELKEKAKFVKWNNKNRKEHYAVIAKSFSVGTKHARCVDLKELEKILKD
jgi:hypothetical protein